MSRTVFFIPPFLTLNPSTTCPRFLQPFHQEQHKNDTKSTLLCRHLSSQILFLTSECATNGKGERRAVVANAVFVGLVGFAVSGSEPYVGLQPGMWEDEGIGDTTTLHALSRMPCVVDLMFFSVMLSIHLLITVESTAKPSAYVKPVKLVKHLYAFS